jgi:hypothetical protein
MTEIACNIEHLCRYLQRYRSNYNGVKAGHLGAYKSHHGETYKKIINEVNNVDITIQNVIEIIIKLFNKLNPNEIKMYGYIILNDIINKKMSIGNSTISDDQINILKNINSQINKESDKITFEKIDNILNEDLIDSIDVEMLINDIQIIPESQPTNSQGQTANQPSINTIDTNNSTSNTTNVPPQQQGTISTVINNGNSTGTFSNTGVSLENIKNVISESLSSHNLCSKQEISEFIVNKFNEFSGLFITTEMADQHIKTLEELLIKQMRIQNDEKILNLHLQAKTAPASLMHTNFPNPLFPDDRCYIDDYNNFISTQQVEWINFNKQQLFLKNDKLTKDILNLKIMVGLKYTDIDHIMLELTEKVTNLLKDEFINENNKMLNVINRKYEVRNTPRNREEIEKRGGKKKRNNKSNKQENNTDTSNKSQNNPNSVSYTSSNNKKNNNNNCSATNNKETTQPQNTNNKHHNNNNYSNQNNQRYNNSSTANANNQTNYSNDYFHWRNPTNKWT